MKIGKEDQEQIIIFDWLRFMKLDDISFHVGNERKCSPQAGALFKRKGIKAGVSDIFIMRPKAPFHGLIIELKVKPNKPTDLQLAFLSAMNSEGYLAVVRYSADEAIATICEYLQMNP
jgi:hypothetical protein